MTCLAPTKLGRGYVQKNNHPRPFPVRPWVVFSKWSLGPGRSCEHLPRCSSAVANLLAPVRRSSVGGSTSTRNRRRNYRWYLRFFLPENPHWVFDDEVDRLLEFPRLAFAECCLA